MYYLKYLGPARPVSFFEKSGPARPVPGPARPQPGPFDKSASRFVVSPSTSEGATSPSDRSGGCPPN